MLSALDTLGACMESAARDAARAYDCAAVQARGPGAKRNFPGEAISELPVPVGEERKQRGSSRYMTHMTDPHTDAPPPAPPSGCVEEMRRYTRA
jgi:hypothetical protein